MLQLNYVASALALAGLGYAQDVSKISPKNGPFMEIPALGLGTWMIEGVENATEAIAGAIQAGYRHFDGATAYGNQKLLAPGFKEGLRRAGLKRSDIWITTKIWSSRHGVEAKGGFAVNNEELGVDYVDLTLMHFPVGGPYNKPVYDYVATWKEMEKNVGEPGSGKPTRFIGISNFNVSMIEELLAAATIKPKVHQFELHPYLQQQPFIDFHKQVGIPITAYASLGDTNPQYYLQGRGNRTDAPPPLLKNPVITSIATARGCTPAQVALKWAMDKGITVHPKAARLDHQKENFEAYTKCNLLPEDHNRIKDMEKTWTFRYWDICQSRLGLPCYTGLERND